VDFKDFALLVVGAILGYLVQVLGDRWRNVSDEFELWVEFRAISLEPASGIGSGLEYRLNGKPVAHPHLVDFYFWSAGKKDITTDQFDSHRSLELNLGVPIVSELEDTRFVNLDETAIIVDPSGAVVVDPSIIRRRMASHYRFITDGVPRVDTVNSIANLSRVRSGGLELKEPSALRRTGYRVGQTLTISAFIVPLVLLIGFVLWSLGGEAGWLPPWPRDGARAVLPWIGAGFLTMFVAGVFLTIKSQTVSRRAKHALNVIRKSLGDKKALPWLK